MAVAVVPDTLERVLAKVRAIFIRDTKLALSYRTNFILQLAGVGVSAVAAYFISLVVGSGSRMNFGSPGMTYFEYLAINLAFQRFQSTGLSTYAEVIRDNQTAGTLEVTLSTPTGLPTIVLSAGLWAFLFSTMQAAVFIAVASLFGLQLTHTNLLTLFVLLLLTVLSSTPLGVIAAAMVIVFKKTGPVDFVMGMAMTIFGGIYIPLSALPVVMQRIGWTLPITHALNGLRAALHGESLTQISAEIVWLSVAITILFPLSLYAFAIAVRHAKFDGTLGQY